MWGKILWFHVHPEIQLKMAYSHCAERERDPHREQDWHNRKQWVLVNVPVSNQCECFYMVLYLPFSPGTGPGSIPMQCEYTIIKHNVPYDPPTRSIVRALNSWHCKGKPLVNFKIITQNIFLQKRSYCSAFRNIPYPWRVSLRLRSGLLDRWNTQTHRSPNPSRPPSHPNRSETPGCSTM